MLVPVKGFRAGQGAPGRGASTPDARAAWPAAMAGDGARARRTSCPRSSSCDDDEVAAWADRRSGPGAVAPGLGLNGAVDRRRRPRWPARASTTSSSPTATCPLAADLALVARAGVVHARTRPPRRRHQRDVRCRRSPDLPVRLRAGSFRRHAAEGRRLGLAVGVVRDARRSAATSTPPTTSPTPRCQRCSHGCQRARPAALSRPAARRRPGRARVGAGHRRPPRRRRVRLRRHARQVGRRRLRRAPPRAHRRLEGDVGRARRHGRPRRAAARTSSAAAAAALGATGEVRVPRRGRRRARRRDLAATGRGGAGGSASCDPRSCSATIRGSATGSTPTIATPGCSPATGIVAARDPHFFPEQGLAPHRPSALLLWEADEPDHVEDVSGHVDAQARRRSRPTRASSSRR